jgi:hypothetical protein
MSLLVNSPSLISSAWALEAGYGLRRVVCVPKPPGQFPPCRTLAVRVLVDEDQ